MRKFEDALPLQLLRAREVMMPFFRPLLHDNALTEQQWRILRALYAFTELESKVLANHCCILSPSLTGILKRLEQRGYIKRRKSEQDQRRTIVSLTGSAYDLLARISPEVEAQYEAFNQLYGEENTKELIVALKKLIQLKKPE